MLLVKLYIYNTFTGFNIFRTCLLAALVFCKFKNCNCMSGLCSFVRFMRRYNILYGFASVSRAETVRKSLARCRKVVYYITIAENNGNKLCVGYVRCLVSVSRA